MTTRKPTVTQPSSNTPDQPTVTQPSSNTPDLGGLNGIAQGLGSGNKSDSTWTAARKDTFDISGLNIPGVKQTQVTGDQLLQIIQNAAATNQKGFWGPLRRELSYFYPGYTAKDLKFNWTQRDRDAVEALITAVHNENAANALNKQPPTTVASALTRNSTAASSSGATYNITNNVTYVPPVTTVPATADLTSIAQNAFVKALGRAASPQEAATFAKEFQSLAASVGDAKADSHKQNMFNPVAQPIQFTQAGGTPDNQPSVASKDTTGLQAAPDPNVAAQNFATRIDPTQASAKGLDDVIGGFLNMARNGGQ